MNNLKRSWIPILSLKITSELPNPTILFLTVDVFLYLTCIFLKKGFQIIQVLFDLFDLFEIVNLVKAKLYGFKTNFVFVRL
jgi:hypothetical protein